MSRPQALREREKGKNLVSAVCACTSSLKETVNYWVYRAIMMS